MSPRTELLRTGRGSRAASPAPISVPIDLGITTDIALNAVPKVRLIAVRRERSRAGTARQHFHGLGVIRPTGDHDNFETQSCPANIKPEITKTLYNPAVYRRILFRFYGSVKFEGARDAE
jgi:hypothetical protein